jgi:hypothetical protein
MGLLLLFTAGLANACTDEGGGIFSCREESAYRAKLAELGYGTFPEGFEGTAWDTVRSTFNTTNSAAEIISQGIAWTSNYPETNNITTGEGPALGGTWGAYDPLHGVATGSPTECDVDNPGESCLFHDGLSGKILPGGGSLHGLGAYITGTTGANIDIILDGVTRVSVGKLPDAGFHFLAVIDSALSGFTRFEFQEQDGKVGQQRQVFFDDFIIATSADDARRFQMNAGLNDAWYNPDTSGQGFFITVFPDLGVVSLAWFTYETEPVTGIDANLGDASHRWLTALGPFVDNMSVMDISFTSGGIFDTATEIQRREDGTITLIFDSCNSGSIEYDIPSINRSGVVPIQRVADDNISICELLNAD